MVIASSPLAFYGLFVTSNQGIRLLVDESTRGIHQEKAIKLEDSIKHRSQIGETNKSKKC